MAGTTWLPRLDTNDRTFLLTSGTVIRPSALEETEAGRKVRIAGSSDPEDSAYIKDIDDLVMRDLKRQAEAHGAALWMPYDHKKQYLHGILGFNPAEERARMWIEPDNDDGTTLWWRFEHPQLKVEAYLLVKVHRANHPSPSHAVLSCQLVYDYGAMRSHNARNNLDPMVLTDMTHTLPGLYGVLPVGPDRAWSTFVAEHPTVLNELLSYGQTMDERKAMKELRDLITKIEDLATLPIPDLRDFDNLDWMDLQFAESNLSGSFLSEVADFLEAGAVEQEIREALRTLRTAFRKVGMILEGNDSHVLTAAVAGDHQALTFSLDVESVDDEHDKILARHEVSLHLPTGSLVITCHRELAEEAAHAWDEARMIADVTDQKEAFQGQAQKYFDTVHRRRTTRAVKVRRKHNEN